MGNSNTNLCVFRMAAGIATQGALLLQTKIMVMCYLYTMAERKHETKLVKQSDKIHDIYINELII